MSATPSQTDPELFTLAHKAGCQLSRVAVEQLPGGNKAYRYFIKDHHGDLMFNGISFDEKETRKMLTAGGASK